MQSAQLQTSADGIIKISGALTFSTVAALWEQSKHWFKKAVSTALRIDLKDVKQSDSAGVALLIAWTRSASQQHQAIHFVNLPEQMRAIVHVSGLEKILPLVN